MSDQRATVVERGDVGTQSYLVKQGYEWALIFLDRTGTLAIVSDYGDYGYRWTHFGPCFKSFLVDTHADYLCGKLCPKRVFDATATLKAIRERICRRRRERAASREDAREAYDGAEAVLEDDEGFAFGQWLNDDERPLAHAEDYDSACYRRNPQVVALHKNLLVPFFGALAEELRTMPVVAKDIVTDYGARDTSYSGRLLADVVLRRGALGTEWTPTVDLRGMPAGALIGHYYASYLQGVFEHQSALLERAKATLWLHDHAFQDACAKGICDLFRPHVAVGENPSGLG